MIIKVSLFPAVEKELRKLPPSLQAQAIRLIDLLGLFGHELRYPHSRKLSNPLFELRVAGKVNLRMIYHFSKGDAIILHIFTKKGNKTPRKEIGVAKTRIDKI